MSSIRWTAKTPGWVLASLVMTSSYFLRVSFFGAAAPLSPGVVTVPLGDSFFGSLLGFLGSSLGFFGSPFLEGTVMAAWAGSPK